MYSTGRSRILQRRRAFKSENSRSSKPIALFFLLVFYSYRTWVGRRNGCPSHPMYPLSSQPDTLVTLLSIPTTLFSSNSIPQPPQVIPPIKSNQSKLPPCNRTILLFPSLASCP